MVYSTLTSSNHPAKYHGGPREHIIDTITIHHMAGDMTAKNCAMWFAGEAGLTAPVNRSSNYTIGSDGTICGCCPEDYESYCSSDRNNDDRAVTIEVANDGGEDSGWHVSAEAINALIDLLVDVCKRNNIPKLLWKNDPYLAGIVEEQNVTVHKWFATTGCPGPYLLSQIPAIVRRVNARLTVKPAAPEDFTDDEKKILKHVASALKKMIEEENSSEQS